MHKHGNVKQKHEQTEEEAAKSIALAAASTRKASSKSWPTQLFCNSIIMIIRRRQQQQLKVILFLGLVLICCYILIAKSWWSPPITSLNDKRLLQLTQQGMFDKNLPNIYLPINMAARVNCTPGIPCSYPDKVDLRIVVITCNRPSSLQKLLQSLDGLVYDPKETIAMEIWIDRLKDNTFDYQTYKIADDYMWTKGTKRVHVHSQHVGIYGQWIDTWRPQKTITDSKDSMSSAENQELALILEDDLLISPYAWIWLRSVHKSFKKDPQCFGYTLQSEGVNNAITKQPLIRPANDTMFMYKLIGSWGFAPQPSVWSKFQDWFHTTRTLNQQTLDKTKLFHPYVNNLVMTDWYKNFETLGKADSMWTMWLIYYTNRHNLYCLYNNLNSYTSSKDHCLAVNREEPGLHFNGNARSNVDSLLLKEWKDQFVCLPKHLKKLEFNETDCSTKSCS